VWERECNKPNKRQMCRDHVARTLKERFSSISQKRHEKVQVFGKCEGAFRQILKCGVEAIETLTGELALPEVRSTLETLTLCTSQINVLGICGGMIPVCLFALNCFAVVLYTSPSPASRVIHA